MQIGRIRLLSLRVWFFAACCILQVVSSVGADCDGKLESGCQNATGTKADFDFSLFDATLQKYLDDRGLKGATAAVVHRDYDKVLYVQGYGNRNADHVFQLASVAKMMTASVLSHLHHNNRIDIRAPIRSLMPTTPLVGWWARGRLDLLRRDFTLEQAMANLSGMPGLSNVLTFIYGACMLLGDYSLQACGRDMFNVAPQMGEPGRFHRYGGAQWQVVGAVAEHVTGQAWEDLVEETFAPCNLGTFGYTNEGLGYAWRLVRHCVWCRDGESCDGCYDSNWQYDPADPPRRSNPNIEGGAYGDARSLAKVLLMLLKGGMCENGRVMSPELALNFATDRQLDGDTLRKAGRDTGYGMGMYHVRDVPGDVWMTPGTYASTPWIDLENGYGAVVLLETFFGMEGEAGYGLVDNLGPVLREIFSSNDS